MGLPIGQRSGTCRNQFVGGGIRFRLEKRLSACHTFFECSKQAAGFRRGDGDPGDHRAFEDLFPFIAIDIRDSTKANRLVIENRLHARGLEIVQRRLEIREPAQGYRIGIEPNIRLDLISAENGLKRVYDGFAGRLVADGQQPRALVIACSDSRVDPTSRTLQIEARIPNDKQAIKPRGGLARWVFADGSALLLTEAGTEKRAGG